MRNPTAMKPIYAGALLLGFMISATLVVGLFTRANGNLCSDGRINCDGAQTGAVYCSASGVQVLYSSADDARQGQQALYVSASQIDSAGVPSGSHLQLASDGSGFTLHRLTDGRLQFTAPGLQSGTLYEFRFPWPGCRGSAAPAVAQPTAPPVVNPVIPASPPTATPTPLPVQIVVNVNCNVAGQYTISMTGAPSTSVSYVLDTNPASAPLVGALNGGSGSATAAYGAGGIYNIVGSYSINGGLPVPVNITNCPG
jgi:hypothetical protein